MLTNLYVKNLALIDEINIDFDNDLTVLTGETGAGKSIILGAISIALGMKLAGDYIRDESKDAVAQLSFYFNDENIKDLLKSQDIIIDDDGELIIRRVFSARRSRYKINGCDVSALQVRNIAPFLLDLHAQRDNLRLLKEKEQLELVDTFAGDDTAQLKQQMSEKLNILRSLKIKLDSLGNDEAARERELDLLRFEYEQLEEAGLKDGEDAELEKKFSKAENAGKIRENAVSALEAISNDNMCVSSLLASAIKNVNNISEISGVDEIKDISDMLYDADSILSDCVSELRHFSDNIDADEEELAFVTERLNIYNKLKDKYKTDTPGLIKLAEEKRNRISELEDADGLVLKYKKELEAAEKEMQGLCKELTVKRKEAAKIISEKLIEAAKDLNFNDIRFNIDIEQTGEFTASGDNKVSFMISTNPGEELRPLKDVASGGELSRIMLAFKTITASTDGMETLIFDEIDTGISGRTAQMVAVKLAATAKARQILCITHLPQIAAMGDHHFLISKTVDGSKSITDIKALDSEERISELSRLLGGDKITDAVRKNAQEMIQMADELKTAL